MNVSKSENKASRPFAARSVERGNEDGAPAGRKPQKNNARKSEIEVESGKLGVVRRQPLPVVRRQPFPKLGGELESTLPVDRRASTASTCHGAPEPSRLD